MMVIVVVIVAVRVVMGVVVVVIGMRVIVGMRMRVIVPVVLRLVRKFGQGRSEIDHIDLFPDDAMFADAADLQFPVRKRQKRELLADK